MRKDGLADALAAVHVARRRLLTQTAARLAAKGVLVGAAAGAVTWFLARGLGPWLFAGPVIGAIAGVVVALSRGVRLDVAALALDHAAGTEEAFVSALTAKDAVPDFRSLAAGYAVARCPRASVARVLPLRTPDAGAAAAIATALLAALVLVPAATVRPAVPQASTERVPVAGSSAGATAESPSRRIEALRSALAAGTAPQATPPAVRGDLASVTDAELRRLAETLAATNSPSADAARRAIAALDRGDRAAATQALRDALGGSARASSGTDGGASAAAPTNAASSLPSVPWSAASWPLRYDRVVRRWFEETSQESGR